MNEDQYSALLTLLVPEIISEIIVRDNIDEQEAITRFYSSQLYAKLSDEHLKLWHFSALTLYEIYHEECISGKLVFPEEAC